MVAILATWISYLIFKRSLRASARPVLVFSMSGNIEWTITNVGSGAAVDVLVGDRARDGSFVSITNCYPLPIGGQLDLTWLRAGNQLVVVYRDIYGGIFTTLCSRNRNTIHHGDLFPEWVADSQQWTFARHRAGARESQLRPIHLHGKSTWELEVMQNEPFARRGCEFKKQALDEYFRSQTWYVPRARDQAAAAQDFSEAEKFEVDLISVYQKDHRPQIQSQASSGRVGRIRARVATLFPQVGIKSAPPIRQKPTSAF